MPLFDAYIFVDWSAGSARKPFNPTRDAVWVGELVPYIGHKRQTYHRTRNDGVAYVLSVLLDNVKEGRRVLVGFDFPYGYPAGLTRAIGRSPDGQSWLKMWELLAEKVKDTTENVNNRFTAADELNSLIASGISGPFWGCPVAAARVNLKSTSPKFPFHATNDVLLQRLRIVETRLSGTQETWKLFGNGSVGSQALVGIPYLYKMRHHPDLVQFSRVWPFETHFTLSPSPNQGPFVLHAEIWPGTVKKAVADCVKATSCIRDQAQVRAMCEWAATIDQQNGLAAFFDSPGGLTPEQIQVCLEEEGWVLGAK